MRDEGWVRRLSSNSNEPAIQVICLGAGGGPTEDNVTGFLVRSTATKWSKNSVLAVDAGSHLAAITRILEQHFPLVSEPRPQSPPKITTLLDGVFAGLPFPNASARANALHVVREHVSTYLITHPHLRPFIWICGQHRSLPQHITSETIAALPSQFRRSKTHIFNNIIWPNLTDEDGGVGLGKGRGYIEVCDGLGVKGFKVSHGHCMRGPGHVHRGSMQTYKRCQDCNMHLPHYIKILIFGDIEPDSLSLSPRTAIIWAEAAPKIAAGILTGIFIECSYTDAQADAVLFGHLSPRHLLTELQNLADLVKTARTEHEQARESARQGHYAPSNGPTGTHTPNPPPSNPATSSGPPHNLHASHPSAPAALNLNSISAEHNRALLSAAFESPLKGLKVVIIHVKDTCEDGPLVGDTILRQLREGEAKMKEQGRGLGCCFEISKSGDAYWF
ncbi:hypothetical protein EJ07DRAFT_170099 [Lizonia empirigonia]|nr:hypothetical protein EJ07DRAFT_170099 [Lizonia empirigonia]